MAQTDLTIAGVGGQGSILAGVILEKAGLAATIARFFELLVGQAVGGLAMVAVFTCMFWGALSGSGPATTAAVGLILLAPMLKHGYDKHFAGATIANASDLSIIIPFIVIIKK